jgi:hypothetical protein
LDNFHEVVDNFVEIEIITTGVKIIAQKDVPTIGVDFMISLV